MLERSAVKVARSVLRRGRASNRSFLFDYVLPLSVGTPQGATTAQRVEEAAKSESEVVMTLIGTQN
jgi:hypothetical protein